MNLNTVGTSQFLKKYIDLPNFEFVQLNNIIPLHPESSN